MHLPNYIEPLVIDGRWVFRTELVVDESAANPLGNPTHRGVLRRGDPSSTINPAGDMLAGLPFQHNRLAVSAMLEALEVGLDDPASTFALPISKLITTAFLPKDSAWYRQADAMLAMLRLGGSTVEPNGKDYVAAAATKLRALCKDTTAFDAVLNAGSLQAQAKRSIVLRAAIAAYRAQLIVEQRSEAFAVLMHCRAFGTESEHHWCPLGALWDDPSPDRIRAALGLWLPPPSSVASLSHITCDRERTQKLLALAANAGNLYSDYIAGDVYAVRMALFAACDDEQQLDLARYPWSSAIATTSRGSIYRLSTTSAQWAEHVASCTTELLASASKTTPRQTGLRRPLRATRLCLAP